MRRHHRLLILACMFAALSIALDGQRQPDSTVLWSIGATDGNYAEFALAPKGYRQLREDGVFVVGRSDAARDWPYVQPGPQDGWAGSRRHAFSVIFTLKATPKTGSCLLRLELVDAHAGAPPTLKIELNQVTLERSLHAGAGDPSIDGEPARGKPQRVDVPFPASALRVGVNQVTITTIDGSWLLYDSVALIAPVAAVPGIPFEGTRVLSVVPKSVWLNSAAGVVQPIEIRVLHSGDPVDVTIAAARGGAVAGPGATPASLGAGVQTLTTTIPAVEQALPATIEIRAGARTLASANTVLRAPVVKDLWLLPHSHVDIGYTHLQQEVETHHVEHLNTVLRLAEASAHEQPGERFAWNTEAMWPLELWLKQATAEERTRLLAAVSRRQVGVNALYANVLTALVRPEELLRVLEPAARFSAQTGVPADTAIICDVPGYTWGLVSAMAQAGVRYFAIAPNAGDRVGTIHAFDYQPFWWTGPTGRERVLAYVVDNYHANGDLEKNLLAQQQRFADQGYKYALAPVFWSGRWPNGGVDNPPPDATLVEQVKAWNAKYARPRAHIATAGEFFAELEQQVGRTLPSFGGDMTPYWEDGAGSTSRETAMNRWSSERLSQAETVWALVAPDRRPSARFSEAWTRALMYSEHTWGAYNSTSEPDLPFVKAQWAYKQAFALDADRQSRQLLDEAVAMRGAEVASDQFDLINTTQWPRTELVIVPQRYARIGGRVIDSAGTVLLSQRLASGDLVFLARDIPAFASRRFRVQAGDASAAGARAKAAGTELTTGRLTVRLDPATGAIAVLRLAGDDRDFVDASAGVGLNAFRYVLGEDSAHASSNGPARITVVDRGPLVATLRVESEAPGCKRLVREVTLVDGLDYVTLVNAVDREAVREKDAVHFGFGFNVPGGIVRVDTPWAVVRPETDQLQVANRNWFTAQRFVDVANGERGITLAPLDAPLVEVGGMTANLLGSVATSRWMTRANASQTIYSWAQNNHWHTNYKADQP
ncbi:MAG: polysaccharide lyase family protein, partial [Bacteroidales bacterium]